MLRRTRLREKMLDVAMSAGGEGALVRRPCSRRTRAALSYAASRSVSAMRLKPMTLGICVFECRPSSVSRPRDERVEQRAVREAHARVAGSASSSVIGYDVGEHLVHAAVFAVEHFLEPLVGHVRAGARRSSPRTSRARRARRCCRDADARRAGPPAPCAWCTRARPRNGLPARLSVSGATPSGKAVSQPPVFAWHSASSATM